MFDKLLGKKQKGIKIFTIPQKKYCTQQKKISKMDKKDLVDLTEDMEKYIRTLTQKLEAGKKEYEGCLQKIDEVNEKHTILNDEFSRINNEHEELSVKFSNLQNSLEFLTQEKQEVLQAEIEFCQQKNIIPRDKIKDLSRILSIYHDQISLSEKISNQNKQLKQKYADLETEYYELSDKYNQQKSIMTTNDIDISPNEEKTAKEENENQEEKVAQLKSIIEGKQQMIISINKQLSAQRTKKEQILQELKNMEEEIAQSIETISKNQETIEQMNKKVKQANDESAECKSTVKKLQNQIADIMFEKTQQEQNIKKFIEEIQKLNTTIEELKKQSKRIEEEKNVILETNNEQLSDVDSRVKNYVEEISKLKNELSRRQGMIEELQNKIKSSEEQINKLKKNLSNLSKKNEEINIMQGKIRQLEEKITKSEQDYRKGEQNHQIKIKKLQFELNSEKIKIQSMKRSLSQFQTKDQENQLKLDEMYEFKMKQQGKMVLLEKKLKEYKHLIQYLKKQKVEMEKTFENKLRNFEEMVVAEPDDEEQCTPRSSKDKQAKVHTNSEGNEYEAEMEILHNKMVDMEETLGIVKMEGNQIRGKVNELELENTSLKNTIRVLNQKRQEAMKEIKRLSLGKALAPSSKVIPQPVFTVEDNKARQKRIAEKAYRGFDILSKQIHPLYKQFVGIHMSDIEKPAVKSVETGINMLLKKTMDMKDIFQDYI